MSTKYDRNIFFTQIKVGESTLFVIYADNSQYHGILFTLWSIYSKCPVCLSLAANQALIL